MIKQWQSGFDYLVSRLRICYNREKRGSRWALRSTYFTSAEEVIIRKGYVASIMWHHGSPVLAGNLAPNLRRSGFDGHSRYLQIGERRYFEASRQWRVFEDMIDWSFANFMKVERSLWFASGNLIVECPQKMGTSLNDFMTQWTERSWQPLARDLHADWSVERARCRPASASPVFRALCILKSAKTSKFWK